MSDDVIGPMFEDLAGNAGKYGEQAVRQLGDTVDGAAEITDNAISEVAGTEAGNASSFDDIAPKDDVPKPAGQGGEPAPEQAPAPEKPAAAPQTSGPPFPVADGVDGPAAGKKLNLPNKRHMASGWRGGMVRDDNTVVLRGNEDAVKADVQGIADGQATWNPATSRYEINGRSYGVEDSGTVFPDSGPGLVNLDRTEYKALSELAKAGGDPGKVIPFTRAPHFVNNPQAIAKAIEIYNGTYSP